jgi:hypothetical protein
MAFYHARWKWFLRALLSHHTEHIQGGNARLCPHPYYKLSQKCRLRSRTRREPMKKRSIHGGVCEHFEEARNTVIGR